MSEYLIFRSVGQVLSVWHRDNVIISNKISSGEQLIFEKKTHLFRRFHIFKTQQVEDKTFDGSLNEIIKEEEDELEDKEDDIKQLKRNKLEKEVKNVLISSV